MGRLARVVAAGIPHQITHDLLAEVSSLLPIVGDGKEFLLDGDAQKEIKEIRGHEHMGRPLGRDGFVIDLEKSLGRTQRHRKSGPKGQRKE